MGGGMSSGEGRERGVVGEEVAAYLWLVSTRSEKLHVQ
jgi:uncharacterized protein YdbL (DUF1318 family)